MSNKMYHIILSDQLRKESYFERFTELEVDVPDKPYVAQVLAFEPAKNFNTEELENAAMTASYFGLNITDSYIKELVWRAGADESEFHRLWISKECTFLNDLNRTYTPNPIYPLANELLRIYGQNKNKNKNKTSSIYGEMIDRRFDFDGVHLSRACFFGNIRLIKFKIAQQPQLSYNSFEPYYLINSAAAGGHIECIKFLKQNGCEWNVTTCKEAAGYGHIECIKYLKAAGCPWSSYTTTAAAGNGHLECLKYLVESKCELDEYAYIAAARGGHLDCLKFVYLCGCKWSQPPALATTNAASKGHLECLTFLRSIGYPWNEHTWSAAAANGHIECLHYLYQEKCPWKEWVFSEAAANGQLECLKLFHHWRLPYDTYVCTGAIKNGHMDCVTFLKDVGCPYDEQIPKNFSQCGDRYFDLNFYE